MKWTKRLLFAVPVLAAAAVLSGCASYDNNYLRPEDFAAYLERDGVKVDGTRPLPGDPFRATSGCAIMIDGNEIGVYKYDRSSSVQEKRVEKIGDEGRTYIQGIPFPVEVRGSFMVPRTRKKSAETADSRGDRQILLRRVHRNAGNDNPGGGQAIIQGTEEGNRVWWTRSMCTPSAAATPKAPVR